MLNRSPTAQRLKVLLRNLEALLTPARRGVSFGPHRLRFVRTLWRDESSQESFDEHILPYFAAPMPSLPRGIVDAGAASGCFSVAAALSFPQTRVFAFEPAPRQRILIARNARANAVGDRVVIVAAGLWNAVTRMPFRSEGHIGAIRDVSPLRDRFLFVERVPVTTLDDWHARAQPGPIDLVKMDIEGAEIEALQGMQGVLRAFRPTLLVQAYHVRDGARTLERCADFLSSFGYALREIGHTGFLVGVHPGTGASVRRPGDAMTP